jgi:hypothetical protein
MVKLICCLLPFLTPLARVASGAPNMNVSAAAEESGIFVFGFVIAITYPINTFMILFQY